MVINVGTPGCPAKQSSTNHRRQRPNQPRCHAERSRIVQRTILRSRSIPTPIKLSEIGSAREADVDQNLQDTLPFGPDPGDLNIFLVNLLEERQNVLLGGLNLLFFSDLRNID